MIGQNVIHAAGIIDQAEADLLLDCGFTHLGFPFRLAKNKPDLTEQEAARIIRGMPSDATALLITYLHNPEEVIELCEQLGVAYVQLHGDVSVDELERLKRLRPDFSVIKSLVVREANQADLLEDVAKTAPFLDGYITDTFDPRTGATGATGMVHDWDVSRRLTADSPRPLIMAGGLNADNVATPSELSNPPASMSTPGSRARTGARTGSRLDALSCRHGGRLKRRSNQLQPTQSFRTHPRSRRRQPALTNLYLVIREITERFGFVLDYDEFGLGEFGPILQTAQGASLSGSVPQKPIWQ